MASAANITRPPRTKRTTSSTTSSTVKSVLFGIAVAYGASYLIGTVHFVHDLAHDLGLLQGEIASLNTHGCTPDVESRKVWYPPAVKLNSEDSRLNGWLKDILVVYDIENEVARSMELVGFPPDVDRVFHGMDFYEDPTTLTSETKNLALTLFVINHRRTGSVVEVFEYTRKQDEKDDGNGSLGVVRYVETIANDLIRTPNDLVAMGKRSFYITNDHYYREGFMRHIEGFGRRPWGDVVFASPEATFIAYNAIASSNGITTNPNRTLVYVSAFHGGTLDIFRPGYTDTSSSEKKKTVEEKYHLIFVESVKLGFVNDNVFHDALTDSLLVAGHSKVLELVAGFDEPEGAPMQKAVGVMVFVVEGGGLAKGSIPGQDGIGG
ncbi:Serum paraoxonase/arylesterase 1 [Linnemannia elongata]|nr:Serum paraoxonase/arylesterase 1 [Linnemannia elongata]